MNLRKPPPTGTITFLFTDIEGSTRLWEQHPHAMRTALACHDAVLRQTLESHGGYIFKTMGDEFCAAFATAPAALAAALEAQRILCEGAASALRNEPAQETLPPLRVRMALHTGDAELRDGDYFGPILSRVHRLLEVGHGGQVLLSLATQELTRDHLADGVRLRDLGEHRLRDLARPERIFLLVARDLPTDFPPLNTLDMRHHNLPVQRTPLLGREQELTALRELILQEQVGLVTLTGPSGTGKTRLGLQVAAELLDAFPDGVFTVPLASVSDPNLVLPSIAQVLEVRETSDRPLLEGLIEHLRERRLLLVLDNFEQVLPAAPRVAELLESCSRLKLIVTSRAVLHLRGEKEFLVPPLSLPDRRRLPPTDALSQYAAVALFIQRARDVKPDFSVTNDNAPAVAEICHRLDGLPLAIELAAARTRLLPPQAMLPRLESRLKLLTGGARDLPERQQTLRAAIAWSYDLLDEAEKMLFRRLSVFVGGASLEAAEAICNADANLPIDLLDGIASLVDKNLLLQQAPVVSRQLSDHNLVAQAGPNNSPLTTDEPRFSMLETIREYAQECLLASGEADAVRQQHARFFAALAQAESQEAPLEPEHGNLRSALAWYVQCRQVEPAMQLGNRLFQFWWVRGYWAEGRERLTELLALAGPEAAPLDRALMLRQLGRLNWLQGDSAAARPLLEESLAIYRQLGDTRHLPASLQTLGDIARGEGDYAAARRLLEECLQIVQTEGDQAGIAWSLQALGQVALEEGDERARPLFERSLELFRAGGHKRAMAFALSSLGEVARAQGDLQTARSLHVEGLALRQEIGHKGGIARSISHLGAVAADQEEHEVARGYYAESLALFRELGDRQSLAICLERVARLARAQDQPERAARLLGAAQALREAINAPRPPAERGEYESVVAAVRAAMGEAAFAAACAAGRALPLDGVIADALAAD